MNRVPIVEQPFVADQEIDRAFDGLPDRPVRLPAGRTDLGGLQEDEGIVADPAAVAAAVGAFGLDPSRAQIQPTESFTVQYVSTPRLKMSNPLPVESADDRTAAVADLEVALALTAVAEDVQVVGMVGELRDEVDHVAVGVARAEDRHEPVHGRRESEALGVRRDEPLGRLRCAVQRGLAGERRILGSGDHLGFPVHRTGRRERNRGTHAAGGLEHIVCDDHVLVEVARGARARSGRRRWRPGESPHLHRTADVRGRGIR